MQDAGREDWGNVDYLADVAYNAGWNIHQLAVEDIGYNSETKKFVDLNDYGFEMLFKLYPLREATLSLLAILQRLKHDLLNQRGKCC